MSSAVDAERRVGLRDHLIRAAELVEVVHVRRAEIDAQRLEHVVERNAELLHLVAIDVGEQLRHVDLKARELSGERGV